LVRDANEPSFCNAFIPQNHQVPASPPSRVLPRFAKKWKCGTP
jgi:hypothetical protein